MGATPECAAVGNIPSADGRVKALQLSAASPFPSPYGRNCFYAPAIRGVALQWGSPYSVPSDVAVHSREHP